MCSRWPPPLVLRQSSEVTLDPQSFVDLLVRNVPEVEPLVVEHISDHGEVLFTFSQRG